MRLAFSKFQLATKTMTAGDLKARYSVVLQEVQAGEDIAISCTCSTPIPYSGP